MRARRRLDRLRRPLPPRQRGVPSPLLIERGPAVASGQTSRSAALVRTHYSVPVVAQMALRSYRFFRDFGTL
ncbi:MAG: FAD-dependent oxidoreductase, partial [Nitrososphaerales archaeon]